MKIKTATAAVSAALLSLIAAGQAGAAQIYPVDQARFMTNARFDFKIELDKSVARKDVTVQINGADYSKTLSGKEVWMEKEDNVHGSALVVRDVEIKKPGRYEVIVKSPEGEMRANWDIYTTPEKPVAKNVIILLADGLSVGHRTAARILSKGVTNGMYNAPLAMDDMPHMALLGTSSVDTIAADSANTASAYMTGHKSSVNALGVYADRTQASQDDPKQETIAELLRRKTNKAIGVVSDAEIEDATPASVVSHTRRRADKADIVGMFYNVKPEVILGGGSAYFLPKETAGSKRKDSINYIQKFVKAGYKGIVNAGVGNGNIHKSIWPVLEQATKNGAVVVRSSRVPTGATTKDAEVDDKAQHWVSSGELNPQKARVLLQLALTKTSDWKEVQKYFDLY